MINVKFITVYVNTYTYIKNIHFETVMPLETNFIPVNKDLLSRYLW